MHYINRLYQKEYDFRSIDSDPNLEYMIATVPRSGSTYMSIELWRQGAFGSPLEYLNFPFMRIFNKNLDISDTRLYWSELRRRRTSPNGVFGYKMFMQNYYNLKEEFPYMLDEIQPSKILYLTRKNVVNQAISYSKAIQTNAWFADVAEKKHPKYDFEHIKDCEKKIYIQMDFWEKIFDMTGAQVMRVYYEDLVALSRFVWNSVI